MIGENLDTEPMNGVRLTPIQDKIKSAAANIRNKAPNTCNTEKLFVSILLFNLVIFSSFAVVCYDTYLMALKKKILSSFKKIFGQ